MQKTLVKVLRRKIVFVIVVSGVIESSESVGIIPRNSQPNDILTYCQHTLYKKTRASHLTGTNMLESK